MKDTATNYTDNQYIDAHRLVYGPLGEHVASSAILYRDRLFRPGFVLPTIRLAPVAPHGKCLALSGNGGSLSHVGDMAGGIWIYLHRKWFQEDLLTIVDEVVLHELLHNELSQFGEDPKHKGAPWSRRCQELSGALALAVCIERPRSMRINGKVTTGTPDGCMTYSDLARWPAELLRNGPSIRERLHCSSQQQTTKSLCE